MSVLTKYVLLQVPGTLLVALVLAWVVVEGWLSTFLAALLLALWIGKDVALYPLLRSAYEGRAATGAEALEGLGGEARDDLAPRGYVRIRGELWQAEAQPDDAPIPSGSRVRVERVRHRILLVRRDD